MSNPHGSGPGLVHLVMDEVSVMDRTARAAWFLWVAGCLCMPGIGWAAEPRPNLVVILGDDLGYTDLGVQGSIAIETPSIDRMAAEGMRLTDFYVAASICTPSRVALMTGSYPQRAGSLKSIKPSSKSGLNPEEKTIAEYLREQGYATACIGKWHLGHQPPFLPTRQGFDYYFGIPYSNNMAGAGMPPLPLMENERISEEAPDLDLVTARFTEQVLEFIEKHKDGPFFVYLAHAMPHDPIGVSDRFRGSSKAGTYGDVIQEIDWSVGEVLKKLRALAIDDQTLVLFSSDNGPRSGSAAPLRGKKGSLYEGGLRVPFIVRWPGKIPAGRVSSELATAMDILPTFVALAGGQLLEDRKIDGKNIWPILSGHAGATSGHECFYYYRPTKPPLGVRCGKWKLLLSGKYRRRNDTLLGAGSKGDTTVEFSDRLFNLETDPGETENRAEDHPEVVDRLKKHLMEFDELLQREKRPPGLSK